MGLGGYFRKLVKNNLEITGTLTKLLRKNAKWAWTSTQSNAMKQVKEILMSRPVLEIYDLDLDIGVHTNASSVALAAILIQINEDGPHPTAYYSKQCTFEQSKYHSYELETMAVIFSLYFRVYLIGREFKVYTDCSAVRACGTKEIPRIARWWLELREYVFGAHYRPGYRMKHVDCLSREFKTMTSYQFNGT